MGWRLAVNPFVRSVPKIDAVPGTGARHRADGLPPMRQGLRHRRCL